MCDELLTTFYNILAILTLQVASFFHFFTMVVSNAFTTKEVVLDRHFVLVSVVTETADVGSVVLLNRLGRPILQNVLIDREGDIEVYYVGGAVVVGTV